MRDGDISCPDAVHKIAGDSGVDCAGGIRERCGAVETGHGIVIKVLGGNGHREGDINYLIGDVTKVEMFQFWVNLEAVGQRARLAIGIGDSYIPRAGRSASSAQIELAGDLGSAHDNNVNCRNRRSAPVELNRGPALEILPAYGC